MHGNLDKTSISKYELAQDPIALDIWEMKYRFKRFDGTSDEESIYDTWGRVAIALASAEIDENRRKWESKFYDVLSHYHFLPAGRIISSVGTGRSSTAFNCFVMADIPDSLEGIFEHLKQAALTMRQGGGIGMNFSTLRFNGAEIEKLGSPASGPLAFMDCWDTMCKTIMSAGSRRGAMMATMNDDHPDIEAFIDAKRDKARFRNFNLSVLISDAFMRAVDANSMWPLKWNGQVIKTIHARELWDKILRNTYDVAEPGVIFIDRMNQDDNLRYCEEIKATNPCGEQGLPAYGACLLGSVNAASLVDNPFQGNANVNPHKLMDVVRIAVRMLDNVIDVSNYPLNEQMHEAKDKRRMGIGITGLADAIAMCGFRYGTEEAAAFAASIMRLIDETAYLASCDLAKERGSFFLFQAEEFLAPGTHASRLPANITAAIRNDGIRNSHLTSIAPTGTISLLAGNVSSGVEPIFANAYQRKVLMPDGSKKEVECIDYAVRLWENMFPGTKLPEHFVTAQDLSPEDHIRMQKALQPHVDSSISKTINCPASISFEEFKNVYKIAYDGGCKGCTTYRPNEVTGSILSVSSDPSASPAPAELRSDQRPAASHLSAPPSPRREMLTGRTYKYKPSVDDHALYVTICDEEDEDGNLRPYEIFFNSKSMEHYQWVVAMSRMISAVFRRGGDIAFVVEELKSVFDPKGGFWHKGKMIPSVVAAIGDIIERHMIEIGFLQKEPISLKNGDRLEVKSEVVVSAETGKIVSQIQRMNKVQDMRAYKQCPKCGSASLFRVGGCDQCFECGYSKCE